MSCQSVPWFEALFVSNNRLIMLQELGEHSNALATSAFNTTTEWHSGAWRLSSLLQGCMLEICWSCGNISLCAGTPTYCRLIFINTLGITIHETAGLDQDSTRKPHESYASSWRKDHNKIHADNRMPYVMWNLDQKRMGPFLHAYIHLFSRRSLGIFHVSLKAATTTATARASTHTGQRESVRSGPPYYITQPLPFLYLVILVDVDRPECSRQVVIFRASLQHYVGKTLLPWAFAITKQLWYPTVASSI